MSVEFEFVPEVPTFTVDLDGPPRGRWKALVEDHREELLEFLTAAAEERKEVRTRSGRTLGRPSGGSLGCDGPRFQIFLV